METIAEEYNVASNSNHDETSNSLLDTVAEFNSSAKVVLESSVGQEINKVETQSTEKFPNLPILESNLSTPIPTRADRPVDENLKNPRSKLKSVFIAYLLLRLNFRLGLSRPLLSVYLIFLKGILLVCLRIILLLGKLKILLGMEFWLH